jgi:hypothetical protein
MYLSLNDYPTFRHVLAAIDHAATLAAQCYKHFVVVPATGTFGYAVLPGQLVGPHLTVLYSTHEVSPSRAQTYGKGTKLITIRRHRAAACAPARDAMVLGR